MDHIVHCMLDADPSDLDHQASGYIEMAASPSIDLHQQLQPQKHQQQKQAPLPPPADEKPFIWRMHSQTERKYQLFPKDKQQPPPLAAGKSLDPEQAFALAMGQNGKDKDSTSSASAGDNKAGPAPNGLRLRIKEHTLIRRRKVSVPELGPMTTVQEVAMDSPTIPGRPPLHERSISAPGNSWMQHHLVECMIPQPAYDEIPEQSVYVSYYDSSSSPLDVPRCNSAQAVLSPSAAATSAASSSSPKAKAATTATTPEVALRLPMSPKNLAPLVIPPPLGHRHNHRHHHAATSSLPTSASSRLSTTPHSSQSSRFRAGSTPVESSLRSARSDESPRTRTPFTPLSASVLLTTPMSAASTTSTLPTPVSASSTTTTATTKSTSTIQPPPANDEHKENAERSSTPKPSTAARDGNVTPAPVETSEPRSAPPQSAAAAAAVKISSAMPTAAALLGHRRGQSESGSIMERGRPRKRSASREGSASAAINAMVAAGISVAANTGTTGSGNAATQPPPPAASSGSSTTTTTPKRTASKASKGAAERRAFEMLPRGWKASEAPSVLGGAEVAALATQALQQAARFEVLRKEEVDGLSRELHNLDERTEYLRRTYTSLRAGRRNLHARICQYLRSPRVAKFSHDSMLKQEEALAELDTSIDDWVTKLEQAENRRTRVRQKLLEHVAAAATLPLTSPLAAAAVAAAGMVQALPASSPPSAMASPASAGVVGVSESLQHAMGIKPPSPPYAGHGQQHQQQQQIATPPRSPTKASFQGGSGGGAAAHATLISPVAAGSSPSPHRPIVAQVPSTILEQPLVEEAMATLSKAAAAAAPDAAPAAPATPATPTAAAKPAKTASVITSLTASPLSAARGGRVDVESIRVYAGDDVYALLADVENQITQMGAPAAVPAAAGSAAAAASTTVAPASAPPVATAYDYFSIPRDAPLSAEERKQLHRAHSQELLNGGSNPGSKRSTPTPPASPGLRHAASSSSIGKNNSNNTGASSPADSVEIFLTSAVFRPERSVLAI